jgi:nitrite reductase/ring-hydroxylating ferredoxin subunit
MFGMQERLIRCHHHGFEYDLESGLPLFTGGDGRLVRYDVRVESGEVMVSAKGH